MEEPAVFMCECPAATAILGLSALYPYRCFVLLPVIAPSCKMHPVGAYYEADIQY